MIDSFTMVFTILALLLICLFLSHSITLFAAHVVTGIEATVATPQPNGPDKALIRPYAISPSPAISWYLSSFLDPSAALLIHDFFSVSLAITFVSSETALRKRIFILQY